VRIELNDKVLTGDSSDTNKPLFMAYDNTPENTSNGLQNDTPESGASLPPDGVPDISIDPSNKIDKNLTQLWYFKNCTSEDNITLNFNLFNAENGLQVCCVVNNNWGLYFVSGQYSTNTVDTASSFVSFTLRDTRY
jgi:hypothetical protein